MKKDLISLSDMTRNDFIHLFSLSHRIKKPSRGNTAFDHVLQGKTMGMIFEKPSTRTSISFAVGMYQLGGLPLILSAQDLQLYRGESVADTARVLSRYVNIIMIRARAHASLLELASYADVPVINGLTDREHPCQILADIFTIIEKKMFKKKPGGNNLPPAFWKKLSFADLKIAYIGDGNNITHSWIQAAAILGMKLVISCPPGYEPDAGILKWGMMKSAETGAVIEIDKDPVFAVKNADIIYTDVWTSMGKEKERDNRKAIFSSYQVNASLVQKAKKDVMVMHCMPAHRGEEITDEIIDGSHAVIIDEAENRLHMQKAIILTLMDKVPQ